MALQNLPKLAIVNVQPKFVQGANCCLVLSKKHFASTDWITQRNVAVTNSLIQRLEKELIVRRKRRYVEFTILVTLLSTVILLLGCLGKINVRVSQLLICERAKCVHDTYFSVPLPFLFVDVSSIPPLPGSAVYIPPRFFLRDWGFFFFAPSTLGSGRRRRMLASVKSLGTTCPFVSRSSPWRQTHSRLCA